MTQFAFPLWYLLVPFAAVLLATTIYMFFNVYHIAKFGMQSFSTTLVLLLYFVAFLLVLGAIYLLIGTIDWERTVSLIDILPFSGNATSTFGL